MRRVGVDVGVGAGDSRAELGLAIDREMGEDFPPRGTTACGVGWRRSVPHVNVHSLPEMPTLPTALSGSDRARQGFPPFPRRCAALTRAMRSRCSGQLPERRRSQFVEMERGRLCSVRTSAGRLRKDVAEPWAEVHRDAAPWSHRSGRLTRQLPSDGPTGLRPRAGARLRLREPSRHQSTRQVR